MRIVSYRFLIIFVIFLQIADTLTTYAFVNLDIGGVELELNVVIRYILEKYGIISVLLFKLIGIIMLIFYLDLKSTMRFKRNALLVVSFSYVIFVINNIICFLLLSGFFI
jgi:hypothetical protein